MVNRKIDMNNISTEIFKKRSHFLYKIARFYRYLTTTTNIIVNRTIFFFSSENLRRKMSSIMSINNEVVTMATTILKSIIILKKMVVVRVFSPLGKVVLSIFYSISIFLAIGVVL
tara:strand:+ start:224 stop:568 length:345 start_codon:yes stop_codon:yes gene_type:complete